APAPAPAAPAPAAPPPSRQSILYWRRSLCDPDPLPSPLAPPPAFLFTRSFVLLSLALMAAAGVVLAANWEEATDHLPRAVGWETLALAWLVLFAVTTLHELAHGLTCKHHGGEVHELGFLLLFFMPCFYCNVSDAWLIREKRKRL